MDIIEKTIRELAADLDISKEAIYRKINHSMKMELSDHIIKRDNKTFISDIGQAIICQSLKREKDEIEADQDKLADDRFVVTNDQIEVINNANLDYVRLLEKQIDLLQTRYGDELINNRREREMLYRLNQSLIDTVSRDQHLQLADKQLRLQTIHPAYVEQSNEPKGFFKRFFKR